MVDNENININNEDNENIDINNKDNNKKKNNNKLIIGVTVVGVVALVMFSSVKMFGKKMLPEVYIAKTLNNTVENLKNEFGEMLEKNNVLNRVNKVMKSPFEEIASIDLRDIDEGYDFIFNKPLEIVVQNDNIAKNFKISSSLPFISEVGYLITNDENVLTFVNNGLAMNSVDVRDDFLKFFENNYEYLASVDTEFFEDIINSEVPVNFSYNNLFLSSDFIKEELNYNNIIKNKHIKLIVGDILKNATVELKKEEEVQIGNDTVKGEITSIMISKVDFINILKNRLTDLKNDNKYINSLHDKYQNDKEEIDYALSIIEAVVDDIQNLDVSPDEILTLELVENKGNYVIARLKISTNSNDLSLPDKIMEISTLGKDYKLNNVRLYIETYDELLEIVNEGDLFNSVVEGTFTFRDTYSKYVVGYSWDTMAYTNNLNLIFNEFTNINFTAGVQNDEYVLFRFENINNDYKIENSFILRPLTTKIEVPTYTTPFGEFLIESLAETFPFNLMF